VTRALRVLATLLCAGLTAAACSHSNAPKSSSATTAASSTTTSSSVTTSTTAPTTTSSTGVAACATVSASAGTMQGAAGTITGSIALVNSSASTCTMMGYPSMALLGAGGTTLPVTMVDGLSVDISAAANAAPALVTLAPSAQAQFTYQYSDVPSGSQGPCPTSSTVSATPPGTTDGSQPFTLSLDPCDNGTIRVSPVYTG
jgi:hypothetical protein